MRERPGRFSPPAPEFFSLTTVSIVLETVVIVSGKYLGVFLPPHQGLEDTVTVRP
jgi:hypothetical protein